MKRRVVRLARAVHPSAVDGYIHRALGCWVLVRRVGLSRVEVYGYEGMVDVMVRLGVEAGVLAPEEVGL